ncbi:MAG: ABC transporter permease, partial [Fidelibacterota bacterium]
MTERYLTNLGIAFDAILDNKIRGFLTSLGIIFGVASVITMLAIGKGAEETILAQMKLLGSNNIIITPNIEQKEEIIQEVELAKTDKKHFSPGLTLKDAQNIENIIDDVKFISPEIIFETKIIRSGFRRSGKLVGVEDNFFLTRENSLNMGNYFSDIHHKNAMAVCIIGSDIRTKFFPGENPIGEKIKCGKLWLTVIGVLNKQIITSENIKSLGIRDYNLDIYTPIRTALIRYKNRGLVTPQKVESLRASSFFLSITAEVKPEESDENYHQLDRIVVHLSDNRNITKVSEIIKRLLERRHNNVIDFEISIPEQLIKQEQKAKRLFNIVLGAIASISLLVGGIGVMNIMLASVLDRFKEIGIRQSIGATRQDISMQFIAEAVIITVTGGCIGIFLG